MRLIAASLSMLTLAVPAFAGGPIAVESEPTVTTAFEPAAPASPDWTGFYAGVQLGYADVDSNDAGLDGNGLIGGIHGGYRYDFGRFVAGAEVDLDAADVDLGDDIGSLDNVSRLKLIGGAELGNSLVYATAGVARADATVGRTDLSDNGTFFGAGFDVPVGERLTVGGEVLQHQFDDFDDTGVDLDATTVKAKVSLRF